MSAELNMAVMGAAGNAGALFLGMLPFALLGVIVVVAAHLILVIGRRRGSVPRSPWGWWAWLVYLGTLASVSVLAITSVVAMIQSGILGGWWLFLHMVGAGAFTFVLPVLAVTWCEAHRWGCPRQPSGGEDQPPPSRFLGLAKAMFWLILIGGLVAIGTMILSMLPVFGTDGLVLLLDIHRYAGLAVVVATVLHLYAALLPRFGVS
ncbi:MAG: hypothetical protein GX575_14525 [Candidatus Anammoximicrobium sp.]|nr:hypothetical protein [Candidatus Anammoximicrobium sp.]